MRSLLKDVKGDVSTPMIFILWVFVIAVSILIVMYFSAQLISSLRTTVLSDDINVNNTLDSWETYNSYAVPSTMLIIFLGLLMGVMVTSFFVRTYAVLIPVYLLFMFCSVLVAVVLGNAWGAIKDFSEFSTILSSNVVTTAVDLIASNPVKIVIMVSILSLIIIFAKPFGGANYNGGPS